MVRRLNLQVPEENPVETARYQRVSLDYQQVFKGYLLVFEQNHLVRSPHLLVAAGNLLVRPEYLMVAAGNLLVRPEYLLVI